ncbi:MAG: phenylalanine--tRNA ligase subunit beta, partial [Microgenomates group bacterium]
VERTPTPPWMAERLIQIGQNVHDSVIDITNYITHDLGHPCHAFDYDKIMNLGGEIIVKQAVANQPFTTLDGESYNTVGGEIIFTNPQGAIIDLPAIKGTANTSISESTARVLLWIESLDPKLVRTASMTHAIRTVAAQLNEKNVDPHLADSLLESGVHLYATLCNAQVASEVYDDFPGQEIPSVVVVSDKKIQQYLGISLSPKVISEILETLGCKVSSNPETETYTIHPPTFRPDLTIPADIIEEIARIYGYHNLPSVLMDTKIPTSYPENTNFTLEHLTKQFLAIVGFQELFTYSLVSEDIAKQSGYDITDHLKLQNPLTEDREYLRLSLIPSLAEVISQNPREGLSVFELANTYHPTKNNLPTEELQLTFVSKKSYGEAKGVVEALFDKLFITNWTIKPTDSHPCLHQSAQIIALQSANKSQAVLGTIGVLKNGWFAAELQWKSILLASHTHPRYEPIAKTSPIFEDYTFEIPERTYVGEILKTARSLDPVISQISVLDRYQDTITVRVTYHNPNQPISSEGIEPLRKKLVSEIEKTYNASLKGTV